MGKLTISTGPCSIAILVSTRGYIFHTVALDILMIFHEVAGMIFQIGYDSHWDDIWWFPEIGVTQNHPFIDVVFHCKPTSYWIPQVMETRKL